MTEIWVLEWLKLLYQIIGLFWLFEPNYGLFTRNMSWELCSKVYWRDSRAQNFDFGGLKGQLDVQKASFRGLIG